MTQKKPQTPESKTLKKLEDMRAGFSEDFADVFDILYKMRDIQIKEEGAAEEIISHLEEIRGELEIEAKFLKRLLIGWSLANFTLAIVVIALLAS